MAVLQDSELEKASLLVIVCSSYSSTVVVSAPPQDSPPVDVTMVGGELIGTSIW